MGLLQVTQKIQKVAPITITDKAESMGLSAIVAILGVVATHTTFPELQLFTASLAGLMGVGIGSLWINHVEAEEGSFLFHIIMMSSVMILVGNLLFVGFGQ